MKQRERLGPKAKARAKKTGSGKSASRAVQPPASPKYTAAELVSKAQEYVDKCQQELAVQFYKRALGLEPENPQILDSLAELLAELELEEEAKQIFVKSCQIAPNQNPAKWMYLAQMSCGPDALQCYHNGIKLLRDEAARQPPDIDAVQKQIASALCAVSGLYMTDLCEEAIAEAQCEQCLGEAVRLDTHSPEPLQALANLRLSQSRPEQATQFLESAFQKSSACTGEDGRSTLTFEFRLETCKLLIEVQKHESAATVVQQLIQEDDENVELWYLLGYCYYHLGEYEDAEEVLTTAHTMFEKLQKFHQKDKIPFPYTAQFQMVIDLLAQAKAKAGAGAAAGAGTGASDQMEM